MRKTKFTIQESIDFAIQCLSSQAKYYEKERLRSLNTLASAIRRHILNLEKARDVLDAENKENRPA